MIFLGPLGALNLFSSFLPEGFPTSSSLPTSMNLLGGIFDRENRANAYPPLFLLVPNI
jgi:hypothetical protein